MEEVSRINNARVLFTGDFNAILDPSLDMAKGSSGNQRGKFLSSFIDQHDFTDVWRVLNPDARRYTCFMSNNPSRLDLFLASPSFLTYVHQAIVGGSL